MSVRVSTALLLVAAVALGAMLVPQWRDFSATHGRAEDRQAALEIAKTEVTELTTLNPTNLDKRLKSLNSRLTDPFSQQFRAMYSTFASVVKKEGVSSRGSIQSVGLVSLSKGRAEILVASRSTVTSPKQKDGVRRAYRFQVSLTKQDSRWLVSGMRFVS